MDLPVSCLSDFFIQRGQILHSDIFASIDHGKFFVVMGVSEDEIVGFFYINSDINRLINTKEEQLQMQILIKKDDYSFLSHDSFICATNIVRFPKSQMIESIKNQRTMHVDTLHKADMEVLLDKVRNSRLYSKHDKETFFK